MKKRKLGIIGGSGLYKMEGFQKTKWKKVKTTNYPEFSFFHYLIISSFLLKIEAKYGSKKIYKINSRLSKKGNFI